MLSCGDSGGKRSPGASVVASCWRDSGWWASVCRRRPAPASLCHNAACAALPEPHQHLNLDKCQLVLVLGAVPAGAPQPGNVLCGLGVVATAKS